ncbi:hypothetical protein CU669_00160 [Paramagnetospirillum kuznetsovii]|uniref:Uncharacterized protein n=1 Tax=Paramagnetospirillum kuznetsovii TaxID=2053833 RepID=A0A364P314_9PROT|nr:hypothetical protein [Paramagnetospirillum kuznetsovii]RAU23557.1 hypothetical protein CU669_00160 [Paramagnetospirillum kuznetsovii]
MILSRIAIVVANPFGPRDYDRTGVATMTAQGIAVTVFDTTRICHPRVDPGTPWTPPDDTAVHRLSDSDDLSRLAPDLARCDLVVMLATSGLVTPANLPVLRWVTRLGLPYLLVSASAMPDVNNRAGESGSRSKRLLNMVQRLPRLSLRASLTARLPLSLLGVAPAAWVVYGGLSSRRPQRLIMPTTREIWAHAPDYESYLAQRGEVIESTDTAVFLDQYLPFHQDWTLVPGFKGIDPDNYFGGLRLLFDRVEAELGLKVVIAAHPRADYTGREHLFGSGRRIVSGRSSDLVRASRLVINSTSMAMSLAVLYRKPLIIYSTHDHYPLPVVWRYIDPICAQLGRRLIFLEDAATADLSDAQGFDGARYDGYVEKYIKRPGSEERPFWDIVLDTVRAAA